MQKWIKILATGILLAGCGYDADDFVAEFCDKIRAFNSGDCRGMATLWDDMACDDNSEVNSSSCEFNKENAKECIDGEWVCDADSGMITFPAACESACPEAGG